MGRVCANASLHWGPRLQRGLDALTGKQTEAQPVCLCECVAVFIYTERKPRFPPARGGSVCFIGYPVMSARFYSSEARTARRVDSGIV